MGKWRKNPYDRFFIHFANCKIERNELISCCKNIDKYFPFAENYPKNRLTPSIDEVLWEKCFNEGRNFKKIKAAIHPPQRSNAKQNPAVEGALPRITAKRESWNAAQNPTTEGTDWHPHRNMHLGSQM